MVMMLKPCGAIICPNLASISPCVCSDANGISVECSYKNLTDLQMGSILNAFLTPGLSMVVQIMAKGNQLTKVPSQMSKFPALSIVDLSKNRISLVVNNWAAAIVSNLTAGIVEIWLSSNQITSIPSGVFVFPFASSVLIDLSNNQIASIASDAFRFPSTLNFQITLTNNKISFLPDSVFTFPSSSSNAVIHLGRNQIKEMPSSAVFSFPSVYVHIDLSENAIKSIPCTSQFNFPRASYFVGIILHHNQISAVPSCAFNFPIARYIAIELRYNLITTVSPGAFNFPSSLTVDLHLDYNQISAFPPNTFSQGNFNFLQLGYNQLRRLESNVFKSPVMKNAKVDIRGNPLDCSTDPCHLTWLLRGKNVPQVLNSIYAHGSCSNSSGAPYSDITSFDFDNICTCTCH